MAASLARGRRRRVLNEEVRSASHLSIQTLNRTPADAGDVQRYGQQAHIENHPQVTDFVPRRKRRVLLLMATGIAVAGAAQAAAGASDAIVAAIPGIDAARVVALADGAVAWTSAAALAGIALLSRLILSLRRHRVDDVRGRYRIWKWAALAAFLLSVNTTVRVDLALASLAAANGWAVTASAIEWQLLPLMLIGGWIFIRVMIDLSESRGALSTMVIALGCFIAAAAVVLPGVPSQWANWTEAVSRVAPLLGYTFALGAVMLYARYVVLDVQGLIEHKPATEKPVSTKRAAKPTPETEEPARKAATTDGPRQPAKQTASKSRKPLEQSAAQVAQWTDGTETDIDDYEDDDASSNRKLSKSQRKKLRKQKARRRAA